MPCEKVSGVVLEQITADAIRWGVDLIVLGPRGRRGIGRVAMGSDAENVLRLAKVPVLLVRAATAVRCTLFVKT